MLAHASIQPFIVLRDTGESSPRYPREWKAAGIDDLAPLEGHARR